MLTLFFIFAAKYLFILSIIIAGIAFLMQPRRAQLRTAIFAALSLILIGILAIIAGKAYFDPRPFVVGHFTPLIPHAADNGFPSDHALLTAAIAAIFSYVASRKTAVSLWIVAILVSIGRVYVGVHHPIDVIGSILISLIATIIVHLILGHYTRVNQLSTPIE